MNESERVKELIAAVKEAAAYLRACFSENGGYDVNVAGGVNAAVGAVSRSLPASFPAPPALLIREENAGEEPGGSLKRLDAWLASAEAALTRKCEEPEEGLPETEEPKEELPEAEEPEGGLPEAEKVKVYTASYPIDAEFLQAMEKVSKTPWPQLFAKTKEKFLALPENTKRQIEKYFKGRLPYGTLDEASGDFSVFENRAKALAERWRDFVWLYERLCDYRSKYALSAFVRSWTELDFAALDAVKERLYKDYFDMDAFPRHPNEVIVDLGAFIGDTVADYVLTYGAGYKRIYCYEIMPKAFEALRINLKDFPNVVFRQKGASDKKGMMYTDDVTADSANVLSERGAGGLAVETVAVDEDVTEPVTLIKMDIEGSEQRALLGCAGHIRNDKPKLAISVYHNNEDIWKIPRMIDGILPGYSFRLRYRGGLLNPTELSLLAVYPE